MKPDKTVISTQTQQPPVPEADVSADSRCLSNPARRVVRRRPGARPKQAALPDQPVLTQSAPTKDDPFSCPPQIYDPNANFIVDSAQDEINELLTPKPDKPPPTT